MSPISRRFLDSSAVRIFAGFALAAVVLTAFGWLVMGPYRAAPAAFDASIRYTMRHIQSPMWTALFLTVTKLGSTIYLAIIGTAAGVVFITLRWFRPLLLLIFTMAGEAVLEYGFKLLVARARPPALISYKAVEHFSFPSGHALASACLYGVIAWFVAASLESPAAKAGVWICTTILVFLIGMSRVYIGVHYPTDVLAGLLGGAIWTMTVMSIDSKPS